jgi:ribosomal protein L16 Arg81 hydroxylase
MSKSDISSVNCNVKLFSKSQLHISKKIREFKHKDKRFESTSAAIRHYVLLGIASENRVELAHSLDGRIIKETQKEVIADSLNPLKETLDKLIVAMQHFENRQENFLSSISKQYELLQREITGLTEKNNSTNDNKYAEEILRCVYILRAIMTVYLLAYNTNKNNPAGQTDWNNVMKNLYVKANDIALQEIEHLSADSLENELIDRLAREFWIIIKKNTA